MSYLREQRLEGLLEVERQRAERAEAECMRLWGRIDRTEQELKRLRRENGQ